MKKTLAIGMAGAAGALLRVLVGQVVENEAGFPGATFGVNMVATFLLCFVAAGILRKIRISKSTEEAVTVGFLGSFSTFSALSMETVLLIEQGLVPMALLYVGMSLAGGIMAGLLGLAVGRKWAA